VALSFTAETKKLPAAASPAPDEGPPAAKTPPVSPAPPRPDAARIDVSPAAAAKIEPPKPIDEDLLEAEPADEAPPQGWIQVKPVSQQSRTPSRRKRRR
jgi:hypothetical protein